MSVVVEIKSDAEPFARAFAAYVQTSKKTLDEILEKKGRDLGIRLFELFNEQKFGGPGKARRGLARAEFDARVAQGQGIKVRDTLLDRYASARSALNFESRSAGQRLRRFGGTLNQWSALKERAKAARERRANLWRAVVGEELRLRQAGIGYLAASFLWFRHRGRGKLVANNTGQPLGSIEKTADGLSIRSFATGVVRVAARYGIVNRALSEAAADMQTYVARKQREAFDAAFARSGRSAA